MMANPFRVIGDRLWEWRAARRYSRTLGRRQEKMLRIADKIARENAELLRRLARNGWD